MSTQVLSSNNPPLSIKSESDSSRVTSRTQNSSTSVSAAETATLLNRSRAKYIPLDEIEISDNSSSDEASERDDFAIVSFKRGRSDEKSDSSAASKRARLPTNSTAQNSNQTTASKTEARKNMIDVSEDDIGGYSTAPRNEVWLDIKTLIQQATNNNANHKSSTSTTNANTAPSEDSKSNEAPACSICLCPFEECVSINCGHAFCEKCLQDWMKQNKVCPQCRKKINAKSIRRVFL